MEKIEYVPIGIVRSPFKTAVHLGIGSVIWALGIGSDQVRPNAQ